MNENEELIQSASETAAETVTETIAEPVAETAAPVYEAAPATPVYSVTPEVVPTPKSKLVPIIVFSAIGAILIAAIIVVAVNFNLLYAKLSPEKYCLAAATKAQETVTKRQLNSPFVIFEDYEKASLDGKTTTELKIKDTEDDIDVGVKAISTRDAETSESVVNLELDILGITADANIFANDKRLAFNSSIFEGNDTYGVEYEDVIRRANDKFEIGYTDEEIDEYQEIINSAAKSTQFNPDDYDDSFLSLRDKFLEIMPAEVSYEKTPLGGVEAKCIAVKYTMTEKEVLTLLEEYLKIVKEDEKLKDGIGTFPTYFGADSLPVDPEQDYTGYTVYEKYVANLEYLIDQIEENYEGTTNIALYSNTKGCLVKVVVDGDASFYDEYMAEYDDEYEAEPVYFKTVLDLGEKPELSSAYSFVVYCGEDEEDFEDENMLSIVLSEKENSDEKYKGTIVIETKSYEEYFEDYSTEDIEIEFISYKSSSNYEATMDMSEKSAYSEDEVSTTINVSGEFTSEDGKSKISVTDFEYTTDDEYSYVDTSSIEIFFEITAEQGAELEPLDDYKELDDWTDDDLEKMSSGFEEFLMRIIYGDYYDDYMGYSEY